MKWKAFNKEPEQLILYGYWRSSASWRVRWALELKGIQYKYQPVNLLKKENLSEEHLKRHPLGFLPVLQVEENMYLHESVAMIEWLEEIYQLKGPSFYPGNALERAKIRSLCEIINASTAPLQTPKVQKRFSTDTDAQKKWAQDFIREGLSFYDQCSSPIRGQFSVYDQVTAADFFLIPQVYNAIRYDIDVAKEFPFLFRIYENSLITEPCRKARPEAQIDSPPSA